MKKFIFKLSLFLFPFVVFLILAEIYFSTITTVGKKNIYLKNNYSSIKVLFLGSSHSQSGINIEHINTRSSNLAFGGQPMSIDYFLLEKNITRLTNLKTVFYEISNHRFYRDLNPKDWNGKIYVNLYDINYKNEVFAFSNYSFVISNFEYILSHFIDYLNPLAIKRIINNKGFVINHFNGRFKELNYDSLRIHSTFKPTMKYSNKTLFSTNCEFLDKTIRLCKAHGIKIIFITTPYYKTYSSSIPSASIQEVNNVIKKYDLKYYNFSNSSFFNIRDFKDDNHLNSHGAVKFSLLLNKIIEDNDLSK